MSEHGTAKAADNNHQNRKSVAVAITRASAIQWVSRKAPWLQNKGKNIQAGEQQIPSTDVSEIGHGAIGEHEQKKK